MTYSPLLQRRRAARRLTALLIVSLSSVAGVATACSSQSPAPPPPSVDGQVATGAAASRSRAAELQAGLTAVLVERVYVTAATSRTVLTHDGVLDSPEVIAALDALDGSSQSLADIFGATYDHARPPLLSALRTADRLQVERAAARAGGDPGQVEATRAGLDQAQRELSAVIRRVVPGLKADAVTDRLLADLAAQLAAEGDAPYASLRVAAGRARDTSRLLGGGIAEDRRLGPFGTRAATLRADLTALLTEHVLLIGALADELAGGREAGVQSARTALSASTLALSDVVGSAYPAARATFAERWSGHVTALDAYASDPGSRTAPASLAAAPDRLGRMLAGYVDGLPADRIAAELVTAQDALLGAVDAATQRAARAPIELRQAVAAMTGPAALLAAAIAEDLQLR